VLSEMNDRSFAGSDCDLHHIIWMIVMGTLGVTLIVVISGFRHAFLKSITFYWPTNTHNCIKLKG